MILSREQRRELTAIQRLILSLIVNDIQRGGVQPSLGELAERLCTSRNAVHYQLGKLAEAGYIDMTGNARGIKIPPDVRAEFAEVADMEVEHG